MSINVIKTKTIKDVKLPYCVVVSFGDGEKTLRNDLVSRFKQGDFSCQVDKYTEIATINFRNESDAAQFLMSF